MNFYTLSDKGLTRQNNEDYAESLQYKWCDPSGKQYALTSLILADGMGGAAAGEFASSLAVQTVKDEILDKLITQPFEQLATQDFSEFLSQGINKANTQIFKKAEECPAMEGMGTTIVVTIICNEMLTVAHVGDSRCYLFREGRLRGITRDHSLVQELLDEGKITPDQAAVHPHKNVITRALGVAAEVEVDCQRMPIFTGDILLLCSDGLSGFCSDDQLHHILKQEASGIQVSLQDIAQKFIQAANMGGGGDNVTVCLYRHSSP